jgi:hypothetical protein
MNIRPQVKSFLDAAETLLSPALLTSPLNQDERELIKMYICSLDEGVVPDVSAPEVCQQSLQL